jgi:hypothetical protein
MASGEMQCDAHRKMRSKEEAKSRRTVRRQLGHTPGRRGSRRLGPLEYMLLALIAVGIAITVVMAILDP